MKRTLVTYCTFSGSTVDVARVVAEEIACDDVRVELVPLAEVKSLEGYDAVVLGAPMIMGWHRAALGFLKKHRDAFRNLPLAIFVMAMSLTQTQSHSVDGVPVFVDEKLAKPPAKQGHLSFRERYSQVTSYLHPILKATEPFKPLSIGVFGGRLVRAIKVVGGLVCDANHSGAGG